MPPMLRYSVMFLLLALFAFALGVWALAGLAAVIARVLVAVFLLLFVVSLLRRRGSPESDETGPP